MTKEKFITQTEILSSRLLKLGRIYGMAREYTDSTVWHYASSNPNFSNGLEAMSGLFKVATYDKLVQYFSDNWPDDYDWPADIDRPPATGGDEQRAAALPKSLAKRKISTSAEAKNQLKALKDRRR